VGLIGGLHAVEKRQISLPLPGIQPGSSSSSPGRYIDWVTPTPFKNHLQFRYTKFSCFHVIRFIRSHSHSTNINHFIPHRPVVKIFWNNFIVLLSIKSQGNSISTLTELQGWTTGV